MLKYFALLKQVFFINTTNFDQDSKFEKKKIDKF